MNAQIEESGTGYNGINATTGCYLPSPSLDAIAEILCGAPPKDHVEPLLSAKNNEADVHLALPFDVDDLKLEETGWGIVFAHGAPPEIFEALQELRVFREDQAGARYKVFRDEGSYWPGESITDWLGRQGAEVGAPQVDKVPYYLMIVGGPCDIPFEFQYELGVTYAVGRLHFETVEEYRQYATNVVAGEAAAGSATPKRANFFGVCNEDDRATKMSSTSLVAPLAAELSAKHPKWACDTWMGPTATKADLSACLNGSPALVFTASHGMGFPSGHEDQLAHQGALLCQDWPGPLKHVGAIPSAWYFSGDDVADATNLSGSVLFHFACYGAGTPQDEDFGRPDSRKAIAPAPFLSRLPQRLLGKPNGAMAVIGHIERAWSYSFFSNKFGQQTKAFETCLHTLMAGRRLGFAMDTFAARHASLAVGLNLVLNKIRYGAKVPAHEIANLWTMQHDARNYVILGDPAVRVTT